MRLCAIIRAMSALLERLRNEASQLPIAEQQALALELLDGTWGQYEPVSVVQDAWDIEIAKRAEEIREGRVELTLWSTVQSDLAKEFGWDK